jgi:hypothetical protein
MKMTVVRDAAQDQGKVDRISASFIREIALLKVRDAVQWPHGCVLASRHPLLWTYAKSLAAA